MGQSEIIETLGKGAAVVGIVVAFGYALTMIGVFVRGLGVAQNTGSVSETVPYITALILNIKLGKNRSGRCIIAGNR